MADHRAAATSPVELQPKESPLPALVALVDPISLTTLPHIPAWTAWLSRQLLCTRFITSSPVCLWKLPYPSTPQALIGSEHDPASQGGGGIHCTCAAETSYPQVKTRNLSGWMCSQSHLLGHGCALAEGTLHPGEELVAPNVSSSPHFTPLKWLKWEAQAPTGKGRAKQ